MLLRVRFQGDGAEFRSAGTPVSHATDSLRAWLERDLRTRFWFSIAQHLFQIADLLAVFIGWPVRCPRGARICASIGASIVARTATPVLAERGFYKKPIIVCWPSPGVNVQWPALISFPEFVCQTGKTKAHRTSATTNRTRI
jgi:hypothetical protein